MQNQLILTEDGSHTIFVPSLDEHYHSTHGAINESLHIYIDCGLRQTTKNELTVFEVGFGTGLNAYLSLCEAIQNKKKIHYFSIEKYPLNAEAFLSLNYPQHIFPEMASFFEQLHTAAWDTPAEICPEFSLHKIQADLKTFDFSKLPPFDLIYYDAFAPSKQPELWTDEIFQRLAANTATGGIITTYCAKGSVRRSLTTYGFKMERLPGPIGKKEILRGTKQQSDTFK